MARISAQEAGGKNVLAFLDMIAMSELGSPLLAVTDDGYNVIVGSTASKPILFASYATHPARLIKPPIIPVPSTAAGRYQLLSKYFAPYQKLLALTDFGPVSQDRIAIQQIRERKALPLIVAGKFAEAVAACSNIWASLPGNGYGQHQHDISYLQSAYVKAGGTLAG
ncbi:glycoside hydrolase family protein [Aquitalea sp. USM4]|uniref:glycoside hydrolase family 24 protein n=1 Tax=Aquitalea sp. USM4 TaxID=1590041 RepID=UPI00103F19EB|nr:glycoside hydrolase family 104 protein [Aquitalea sp. USM4]QBJ80497.1 glycoside hydrolase [Aquitalea sp. USM4]